MAKSLPMLPSLPKMKAVNRCACGCGRLTGRTWFPGCDGRQVGIIKRVESGAWTLDKVAEWGGEEVARCTAKAMGLSWEPTKEEKVG